MGLCFASLVWIWVQCLCAAVLAVDCQPATKVFTIKTAQDVADIATCETFTGNLVIAADGPETVSLDGVKTITGNFDVEGVTKLRLLSSKSLQAVSSFTLNNLPRLSNLTFPSLKDFSSLKWSNLPSLKESTIATGALDGEIQEITIVNTSLTSLKWLKWPIGSHLNISGNAKLEAFTIPYSTINAGSALTISNNAALETLDLQNLAGIYGGLEISRNKEMTDVSFNRLQTIGGFVQMSGDFTNLSMPVLNSITGALKVESTGDISGLCDDLEEKKLRGHYDCETNIETQRKTSPTDPEPNSQSSPTTFPNSETESNDTPPEDSKSELSTGVKTALGIAALAVTVLVIVIALFYFRRRSRAKVREISSPKPASIELDSAELSEPASALVRSSSLKELESPNPWVSEMSSDIPNRAPQELDATHGMSELHTPTRSDSRASFGSMSLRGDVPFVRHELPG